MVSVQHPEVSTDSLVPMRGCDKPAKGQTGGGRSSELGWIERQPGSGRRLEGPQPAGRRHYLCMPQIDLAAPINGSKKRGRKLEGEILAGYMRVVQMPPGNRATHHTDVTDSVP